MDVVLKINFSHLDDKSVQKFMDESIGLPYRDSEDNEMGVVTKSERNGNTVELTINIHEDHKEVFESDRTTH